MMSRTFIPVGLSGGRKSRDRIAYLTRQAEELIAEKRKGSRKRYGRYTIPISGTAGSPLGSVLLFVRVCQSKSLAAFT